MPITQEAGDLAARGNDGRFQPRCPAELSGPAKAEHRAKWLTRSRDRRIGQGRHAPRTAAAVYRFNQ